MSLAAFDRLDKQMALRNARESLRTWEAARGRADLTAGEVEFLDRAIASSRQQIEARKLALNQWWA